MKTSQTAILVTTLVLAITSSSAASILVGLVDTGEIYASDDSGASWHLLSTLPIRDAVSLCAGSSDSDLALATRSGAFFVSTDAGLTWSAHSAVAASDVAAMTPTDVGVLVLITESGTIWESTDEGAMFSPIAALPGIDHVSLTRGLSGMLFVLTESGAVFESLDAGISWQAAGAMPISDAVEIVSSGEDLYVLTESGEVWRCIDGDGFWQPAGDLSQVGMSGFVSDGAGCFYAASREGEVAVSSDGETWDWVGAINQLNVTALATDLPVVAVPGGGEVPVPFAAGAPRPNPVGGAHSALTIPVSLLESDTVRIDCFDARGRWVAGRESEHIGGGDVFDITWEILPLPAGVFFARLSTGSGATASARWVVVD